MHTIKTNPFKALSLSFSDKALEKTFRKVYFRKTLLQVRLALVFAAILYGLFGILDCLVIPEIRRTAWFIRFAVVSPLILSTYALTYTRFFRNWMRPCLFVVGIASGVGIVEMIVLAPSPGSHLYYSGVLLCVLFYFVFIPDLLTACLLSWSLLAIYVLMVVFFSDISLNALMNNASAFLAFNLAGMFASYSFERHMRSDFMQRRTIKERTEQLRAALQEVEKARGKAEELSLLDPLTGLFNRRHFFSVAEIELARKRRIRSCVAVIMLDIDHFKSINDTHGHRIGDLVLQKISQKIKETVRTIDTACRYGGDEFAILLPETDHAGAEAIGWRLQKVIEGIRINSREEFIPTTASVGVSVLSEVEHVEADVLVEMADQALYKAKRTGRNQVMSWTSGNCRGGPTSSPSV